jgi:hypothetical protein
MYPIVDEAVIEISKCEIDAVKDANYWKLNNDDKKPKMLEQSIIYAYNKVVIIVQSKFIFLLTNNNIYNQK